MAIRKASIVVLKKVKMLAPDLHRYIAAKQAVGSVVQTGDRILIYEVQATLPNERVLITEETRLDFC